MKFLKKLKKSLKALFSLKPPPKRRKKKAQDSELPIKKTSKQKEKRSRVLNSKPKIKSKAAKSIPEKIETKNTQRLVDASLKTKKKEKPSKAAAPNKKSQEQFVGIVTHYFPKAKAAVIDIKKIGLKVGDPLLIRGKQTEFRQMLTSLQVNRKPIESAKPGKEVGLEVLQNVQPGDCVFVVKP